MLLAATPILIDDEPSINVLFLNFFLVSTFHAVNSAVYLVCLLLWPESETNKYRAVTIFGLALTCETIRLCYGLIMNLAPLVTSVTIILGLSIYELVMPV